MKSLPRYAKEAFKAGRTYVTSLDNPQRRLTQQNRIFQLDYKGYNADAPDFNENGEMILGTPYTYTIIEMEMETVNLEEVAIATHEFNTVE